MWYQWLGEAADTIAYGYRFSICNSFNHCHSATQYTLTSS
ncbi:unnamed protein product [Fusarium graminearum]|uniref:Chromosome 2, complete genome n=2 Tax=Gibberella zeae TaxID=5518 RepID=A0A098DIY2_GIBZE|nr:unnamed protein product [Fusarium graminearum]